MQFSYDPNSKGQLNADHLKKLGLSAEGLNGAVAEMNIEDEGAEEIAPSRYRLKKTLSQAGRSTKSKATSFTATLAK